jgi:signal transduction histidine kinase
VAYFHEGQYDNLPVTGGPDSAKFSAGKVLDLSRDADGAFWLATDEGLRRIAGGHAATLSMANGLPCNLVHWIIEDDSASYWLYTRCGLLRIARSEMAAWIADPRRKIGFTTFDASDGVRLVPALSGYRPQVAKSADGRIWFINFDTLSYFDPSRMAVNALPPPVRIERLTADRKGYDAAAELRLPALVRDISVDYTALSLVAPEKMHFRYKLEGQDLDWREVVNDREARYSNLPPATYRFRVIASNNSGVWNEEGASLQFSIAPAYWQTTWFRLLCGAACLGLLVLLYWLRVRQLAIQFNMKLDARVGERTRIARELHDTMLQSFQGVLLQLQAALRFLSKDPRKTEKILVEVIDQAAEAIKGGREAVQGLRASTQQSNDLAAAIASVGREMFARRGGNNVPALRVEVEGVAKDLHPIIRDEIFRVVAEALRNALQHSCGTQVEVQLWYGPREFRVRVRDDGQGIDQKILADGGVEGHFGLGGMRERATLIGAKLTVWSALGSGTEVELVIAESKAYQSAIVRDRSK